MTWARLALLAMALSAVEVQPWYWTPGGLVRGNGFDRLLPDGSASHLDGRD